MLAGSTTDITPTAAGADPASGAYIGSGTAPDNHDLHDLRTPAELPHRPLLVSPLPPHQLSVFATTRLLPSRSSHESGEARSQSQDYELACPVHVQGTPR